jgi:23S rRNA G2445 N2-methylase RlmL
MAELTATLDGMQKGTQEPREPQALDPLAADIDALARLTSTLSQVFLIASGFHQHKRQWRKQKA